MGQLIDDLLEFFEVKPPVDEPIHGGECEAGKNGLDELKPHWEKDRQIDIRVGELRLVTVDAALLKQVWVNLINNAVKYSRGRKPAVVEIGCLCQSNPATYYVRDNGTGFDMQYAHKLFGRISTAPPG